MRRYLIVASLVATLALAGCSSSGSSSGSGSASGGGATTSAAPGTTVAVQKDVLAVQADPPGAPGRTLTLIRYTIAPGAKLAPHIHPGIQLAEIESGTLTYTVEEGTAIIHRGSATGPLEEITAPATTTLGPGDTVAEVDGMVHFGANDTDQPIVINATLLTIDGDDLAVPVTTPSATTAG